MNMTVNVYMDMGSISQQQDVAVLKSIFKNVTVNSFHICDVNIHLEIPRYSRLKYAIKNYIVPNPKTADQNWDLRPFTKVLCKSYYSFKVFNHLNSLFTSWTSQDIRQRTSKKFMFLHSTAGRYDRGTLEIVQLYKQARYNNIVLPPLIYVGKKIGTECQWVNNVFFYNGFISEVNFRNFQNSIMFHLCPYYYEDFSHTMWEGLSTGAIVLTTNHSPMDIIGIKNLIDIDHKVKINLVEGGVVSLLSLYAQIITAANMSEQEALERSEYNRGLWSANNKSFINRIKTEFNA